LLIIRADPIGAPEVCLKPDEKLPVSSCKQSAGSHIVTNVRIEDPDRGLNVRDKPDLNGTVLGVLQPNTTEVIVGACQQEWCPVQCNNVRGWSRDRYLALGSSSEYIVNGTNANNPQALVLRNGPDQTCSAVGSVPHDARVTVHVCQLSPITKTSIWCLITHGTKSGWAQRAHLAEPN